MKASSPDRLWIHSSPVFSRFSNNSLASGEASFASGRRAFSLVELLVVIAVIAIIAAIAIPNIANVSQTADAAKVRRNAQTVASTYNAAVAAGMPTNAVSTLEDAVAIIQAGTNIVTGNTSQYYSVDGLSAEESTRAQGLLTFTNGLISISAQ